MKLYIYNGRGVINETNDFITLQYMMVILIYIKAIENTTH
jgi:hypothetical protein